MTAPAVVAWGAHLGWLHHDGGLLGFFANKISLVIFSLFAAVELVADKLPFIPSRTEPGPLGVRIVFGALCGAALCISSPVPPLAGATLGGVGGVVGAFAGFHYRRMFSRGNKTFDFVIALCEDLVAVGGGFLIVSHF